MNTRITDFIDVGDPAAPIGSPAWCKASHLQLCATKRQTDQDVRHLKFHLVDFKEKERWKNLADDQNRPFRSWKEYLTYPEPNGLGISEESAKAIMAAVDGELIGEVLGKQGHPSEGSIPCNTRYGTAKHWLLRLERDGHSELAAKVRAGEMSADAAAKKVGYRKQLSPFDALQKLIRKSLPVLSHEECEKLRRMFE